MNKAGRRVLVEFVMTATIIYLAMALDLPPWAVKDMEKICRGFLWRGRMDAKGGSLSACMAKGHSVTGTWWFGNPWSEIFGLGSPNEMAVVKENSTGQTLGSISYSNAGASQSVFRHSHGH